ncbi:MAG: TIGR03435 family protein [Acidobacteriia bacterium]|nr:TIGR03435 family protein [Terriglobia bacterium]
MKMPTLLMIAVAALPGSGALAQDITGTWQGTVVAGRELRTVVKIAKTPGGLLSATLYSIDQPAPPIPVTSVTFQGSVLRFTVAAIGGTYEGKLSGDGNTITGTMSQGPTPLPLNLTRATAQTAWAIPEPPPPPKLVPADANPVFEVATVKPSNPDERRFGINVRPGGAFATVGTTLRDLMTFAFGIHARQIISEPGWGATDKFDITAKPDIEGIPNDRQIRAMMQKLLADRFKLTIHHDQKELTVYTITVAQNGPKLTKSQSNGVALPGLGFRGPGNMMARNATIGDVANLLQTMVFDRPVVDQTGLKDRFDLTLNWAPDETQFRVRGDQPPPPPPAEADTRPDLFKAIQEQLGLKLESTKAPVDVLVIDHVEKPESN